jgi:hypothetical protein
MLNRLLGYTLTRLKEKYRFCFQAKDLHKLLTREEEENFYRFVYMPMDLHTMETKVRQKKYHYLEQFQADVQVIFHNVVLCYTVDHKPPTPLEKGGMAELVKVMVKDCAYDLEEIRQCKDCYNYSNAKPKDWFCQPCYPPHELVYAKQKGFSYWPAKVIKKLPEGNDVRFFGGWHQRAVIPQTSIKPVETTHKAMAVKKTSGFNKACDEMKRHRALVEQMKEEPEDEEEEGEEEVEEEPYVPPTPKIRKKKEKKEKQPKDVDPFGFDDPDMFEEPKPKTKKRKREHDEDEDLDVKKSSKKKKKHRSRGGGDDKEDMISSSSLPDRPAATPEDANLVTSSKITYQDP